MLHSWIWSQGFPTSLYACGANGEQTRLSANDGIEFASSWVALVGGLVSIELESTPASSRTHPCFSHKFQNAVLSDGYADVQWEGPWVRQHPFPSTNRTLWFSWLFLPFTGLPITWTSYNFEGLCVWQQQRRAVCSVGYASGIDPSQLSIFRVLKSIADTWQFTGVHTTWSIWSHEMMEKIRV